MGSKRDEDLDYVQLVIQQADLFLLWGLVWTAFYM